MMKILGFLRIVAGTCFTIVVACVSVVTLPLNRGGRMYHALARLWSQTLVIILGIRVHISGLEKLDPSQNYVYVCNHASLVDIPAVLARLPGQIRIMYKRELEGIPVFGWGLKWGGYIGIDRRSISEARKSLEEAVRKIRAGASVFLYAEGTRTLDGRLQPFKRGAFNLALKTGLPVVPLTINGSFNILPKGSVSVRRGMIDLILEEPILAEGREGREAERELMERVHTAIARHYIDQ